MCFQEMSPLRFRPPPFRDPDPPPSELGGGRSLSIPDHPTKNRNFPAANVRPLTRQLPWSSCVPVTLLKAQHGQ